MSNKEEDFVPYFKIKWSRRSAWALEQAAYLSCGKNPEAEKCEISVVATNSVSKRYYWLLNKLKKEHLKPVEVVNGTEYFNTGSLFRILEERFKVDKEMRKALDHMYMAPCGIDHIKFISRSVYREAGRLVFNQYPDARIIDVAEAIKDLPKFFNNDDFGHIEILQAVQIAPYLKNLSNLKQKPKQEDICDIVVDLSQLIESM